jgi:hypothetical protein
MSNTGSTQRITAFDSALNEATALLRAGSAADSLDVLKRAHVLGQQDFVRHLRVHWLMLRAGWDLRDVREVVGQVLRILLVAPGHLSGRLPKGNPGTADVSAFATDAMPPELAQLLEK